MKHEMDLPLQLLSQISRYSYIPQPTPTDALEIAILSGGGIV
jgi:hypothetical protein